MKNERITQFGVTLEGLMEETGLRQRDLARMTGLQESLISRVKLGQTELIKHDVLKKIIGAFSKDPRTSADTIERSALLVAAHCLDEKIGVGSDLISVSVAPGPPLVDPPKPPTKTDRALLFLADAARLNELNANLVWHLALAIGMKAAQRKPQKY